VRAARPSWQTMRLPGGPVHVPAQSPDRSDQIARADRSGRTPTSRPFGGDVC